MSGRGKEILFLRLPDLITLGLALAIFLLLSPGLMSADSIEQYRQALHGDYNDWHPPLMALLLSVVLSLGGGISWLTLAQALAGAFGLRALAQACLRHFFGDGISRQAAGWISLGILFLLLLPFSPLLFYLMTFWKDCWEMVLFLWIGAAELSLFQKAATLSNRWFWIRWAGLAVAMVVFGVVRHNALPVLALFGWLLWLLFRQRQDARAVPGPGGVGGRHRNGKLRRLGLAFLFVAALPGLGLGLDSLILEAVDARRLHQENMIMILDLVGICVLDDAACEQLPLTKRFLDRQAAKSRYRFGLAYPVTIENKPLVDPEMFAPEHAEELHAEYRSAMASFPGTLLMVKFKAFCSLLGLAQTNYFIQDGIVPNDFGLTLNETFAAQRELLARWTKAVGSHWCWRWLAGVHLVWLLACLGWIGSGLIRLVRRSERKAVLLLSVVLSALGYYLSYLVAAPVRDFRFMYPATLLVQVLTLSWAVGWSWHRWATRRARRGGEVSPSPG